MKLKKNINLGKNNFLKILFIFCFFAIVFESFAEAENNNRFIEMKILDKVSSKNNNFKGGVVRFKNIKARQISTKESSQKILERPNILWITAEDMSPTLGCYGDSYAITPNIDKLANLSTRYSNAFAASPVCSPSRSVLITGMHNVSTGTHQMRSGFPLPKGVKGFPSMVER